MKKFLPEPGNPGFPHPCPSPRGGGARREPHVQTILPFLDPKKKPQQIRDFEGRKR